MVLAALAVTTEYRFGTIRTTFQAVPNRTSALLAKTVVVALLALAAVMAVAVGALGLSELMKPSADLALNSAADWLNVAGPGWALAYFAGITVTLLVIALGVAKKRDA